MVTRTVPPRTLHRGGTVASQPAASPAVASTRVGVTLAVDFGQPAPREDAWVQSYRNYLVQPYVVVYGLPYDLTQVLGVSIRTDGGVGSAQLAAGRLAPDAVSPNPDVRFLAENASTIGTNLAWYDVTGTGPFYLAVRSNGGAPASSNHSFDAAYQIYLDGDWVTFSAVDVGDDASNTYLAISQILMVQPMSFLMACVPHASDTLATYPILQLPGGSINVRGGKIEVVNNANVPVAQVAQVGLAGTILLGISIDPVSNNGFIVAAGNDAVEHLAFDATGLIQAYAAVDGIAFGGGPVDWLEMDFWYEALSVGQLEAAVSVLESVYGVTA